MKLVLFDIGGVIEKENGSYNTLDIRVDTIKHFNDSYSDEEILDKWTWEVDGINLNTVDSLQKIEEWFIIIKRRFNLGCTLDEFIDEYHKNALKMPIYKDVIEYMNSLMDKGINVGLLSNTVFLVKDRLRKNLDYNRIPFKFLSFELGLAKPDIEIFNYVIKNTGIEPKDIIFFDNKEGNVKSAIEAGINALCVTGDDISLMKDFVNKHI